MEDLVEFAKPVLKQMFPQGEERIPWCLEYKCRNNEKVQRKEIRDFLCKEINLERNPVQYDGAKIEVVVEVYRDLLIFGVIPGYKTVYRKCNLQQLTQNS